MSALTEARNTVALIGPMGYEREVATSNTIYAGALVAQNSSGKAIPAADTASTIVLGRAANTAAAGETVRISAGIFFYDNGTSTEALAVTDIGKTAYIIDDHTVGKVGGTNKIPAGTVLDVTSDGVAVQIGRSPVLGAAVADCTFASSTATNAETKLNSLLASLRAAGIIASA